MRGLVLRVIDAIRRLVAGHPPPPARTVGRVAHPQHGAEHPHRTTWNVSAMGSRTEIQA